MVELAHTFYNETDALKLRVLNQCAREVLLAQSSDWLFIITNGTMVDYAKKRIKDHVGRFNRFYEEETKFAADKTLAEIELKELEEKIEEFLQKKNKA